jgi:hypothetical protein
MSNVTYIRGKVNAQKGRNRFTSVPSYRGDVTRAAASETFI